MPIKDISDRRRPPRGGKLRIGEKVTHTRADGSTVEAPSKLDHFLFDPEDLTLLPIFEKLYGKAPKSLPVMFYSDVREEVFPHYLKNWKSSKLWCWGDGETAHRSNFETGQVAAIPCAPDCPYRCLPGDEQIRLSKEEKKQRSCRPEGTLRVILYEMPTLAVFDVRASLISIIRINTGLDMIQNVVGHLAHVPLVLLVVPVHQNVGGKSQTNYCLQIDIRTPLIDLMRQVSVQPAGLLTEPAEVEEEPQDAGGNGHAESQSPPAESLRETFKGLMGKAIDLKLIDQPVYDSAVSWSETASDESLQKKIARWKQDVEDIQKKAHAGIAMQTARDLDQELLSGRDRSELLDTMAGHPGLNGHRDRLGKAFADAAGDPQIEKAVIFEAQRLILAVTTPPHE